MSGEERHYWPTATYLAALRDRGLVPYSPMSTRCVAAAAAIGGCFACRSTVNHLTEAVISWWRLGSALPLTLVQDLVLVAVVPPLCAALGALVWGFAQTRLLFSIGMMVPETGRLWSAQRIRIRSFLGSAGARVILAVGALGVGGLCFAVVVRDLFSLLRSDRAAGRWLILAVETVAPWISIVLFLAAVVLLLLARFSFMRSHRMTRAELESEARSRE